MADEEVAVEEIQLIVNTAVEAYLPSETVTELLSSLRGEAPLRPANLQLLRRRRADAVAALSQAFRLAMADGKVTPEEVRMLKNVQEILGAPTPPAPATFRLL